MEALLFFNENANVFKMGMYAAMDGVFVDLSDGYWHIVKSLACTPFAEGGCKIFG